MIEPGVIHRYQIGEMKGYQLSFRRDGEEIGVCVRTGGGGTDTTTISFYPDDGYELNLSPAEFDQLIDLLVTVKRERDT